MLNKEVKQMLRKKKELKNRKMRVKDKFQFCKNMNAYLVEDSVWPTSKLWEHRGRRQAEVG